jgi:hypothetical protein
MAEQVLTWQRAVDVAGKVDAARRPTCNTCTFVHVEMDPLPSGPPPGKIA